MSSDKLHQALQNDILEQNQHCHTYRQSVFTLGLKHQLTNWLTNYIYLQPHRNYATFHEVDCRNTDEEDLSTNKTTNAVFLHGQKVRTSSLPPSQEVRFRPQSYRYTTQLCGLDTPPRNFCWLKKKKKMKRSWLPETGQNVNIF